MIKIKKDVTDKYYDMLNSFRADNAVKIEEIQNGTNFSDKTYYEVEKELIKNNDERLMKDIELLEALEFDLRHEFVKIVEIDRDDLVEKVDDK